MADESHLARIIALQCYRLAPRIEPLARYNNLVFRLRFPDDSKILKLAKGPEPASIRKELVLIRLLGQHGIPVPVIEHEDGQGTLVGRPFFIMASAGEQTIAHWVGRPGEPARRLFAEMGSVLARIHGITLPESGDIHHDGIVPRDPREYRQRLYRLADWALEQRLLDAGEVSRFKSLDMPPMTGVELCHGDFHTVQCIVHNERMAAVVDWQSAWAGNSAIDLAIAHTYLDYYCPPDLICGFLAGYTSVRSLTEHDDPAYLPVRMAHALGLLRVWHAQDRQQHVSRAIELYRAYARRL